MNVNLLVFLFQLVQITINMGYLEKSCELLEQFIARLTSEGHSSVSAGHLVRLKEDVFRVKLTLNRFVFFLQSSKSKIWDMGAGIVSEFRSLGCSERSRTKD